MDLLAADFMGRYRGRGARQLILDTKPRYRAQFNPRGLSAGGRYKGWDHGKFIPNSMVVDTPDDLLSAWKLGCTTAIVQTDTDAELGRLVATAALFLKQAKRNRPQLFRVDETLDFYHTNGAPRGGADTIARMSRSGRERGISSIYGSQRMKGLPPNLKADLWRLYAMIIDYASDVKLYGDIGAPPFEQPERPHEFVYWVKSARRHVYGPYKLAL